MKYVLTAAGERYLARVNAQMIRMHLVRVEVGSGVSAAPEKLEALLDVKQRLQIESVEQDVNEAVIHCMLTIWSCMKGIFCSSPAYMRMIRFQTGTS